MDTSLMEYLKVVEQQEIRKNVTLIRKLERLY